MPSRGLCCVRDESTRRCTWKLSRVRGWWRCEMRCPSREVGSSHNGCSVSDRADCAGVASNLASQSLRPEPDGDDLVGDVWAEGDDGMGHRDRGVPVAAGHLGCFGRGGCQCLRVVVRARPGAADPGGREFPFLVAVVPGEGAAGSSNSTRGSAGVDGGGGWGSEVRSLTNWSQVQRPADCSSNSGREGSLRAQAAPHLGRTRSHLAVEIIAVRV